jgi:tetratricopeptide (TPR) repeat protein
MSAELSGSHGERPHPRSASLAPGPAYNVEFSATLVPNPPSGTPTKSPALGGIRSPKLKALSGGGQRSSLPHAPSTPLSHQVTESGTSSPGTPRSLMQLTHPSQGEFQSATPITMVDRRSRTTSKSSNKSNPNPNPNSTVYVVDGVTPTQTAAGMAGGERAALRGLSAIELSPASLGSGRGNYHEEEMLTEEGEDHELLPEAAIALHPLERDREEEEVSPLGVIVQGNANANSSSSGSLERKIASQAVEGEGSKEERGKAMPAFAAGESPGKMNIHPQPPSSFSSSLSSSSPSFKPSHSTNSPRLTPGRKNTPAAKSISGTDSPRLKSKTRRPAKKQTAEPTVRTVGGTKPKATVPVKAVEVPAAHDSDSDPALPTVAEEVLPKVTEENPSPADTFKSTAQKVEMLRRIGSLPRQQLSQLATANVESGDFEEALSYADAVIAQSDSVTDPHHRNALFVKGSIFRRLGLATVALRALTQALNLNPQESEPRWERALLLLQANNESDALVDLSMTIQGLEGLMRQQKQQQLSWEKRQLLVRALHLRSSIYLERNRTEEARVDWQRLIELDPQDTIALYLRGLSSYTARNYKAAIHDWSEALAIQAASVPCLFMRGKAFYMTGKYSEALSDFSAALRVEPAAEGFLWAAKCQLELKNHSAAIELTAYALEQDPSSAEGHILRGAILRKVDPTSALRDLSIGLLLDSSRVDANVYRSAIYAQLGWWAEAVDDMETAIQVQGKQPLWHLNAAVIYLNFLQKPHLAVKHCTQAISLQSGIAKAYLLRAEAFFLLGSREKALRDYSFAVHLEPWKPLVYLQRGRQMLSLQRYDMALFDFVAAATLSPQREKFRKLIPTSNSFLSNFDVAVDQFSAVVQDEQSFELYCQLGMNRMKAGNPEDALDDFSQAITLAGKNGATYLARGRCLMKLNRLPEAISDFSQAIELNPMIVQAYHDRAYCKTILRLDDWGLADYAKTLQLDPTFVDAYLNRAGLYQLQGNYELAIQNFTLALKYNAVCIPALVGRCVVHAVGKDFVKAMIDIETAVGLENSSAILHYNKGVLHHICSEYDRGIREYSVCLLISPHPFAFRNRGLIYFHLGDMDAALADFRAACRLKASADLYTAIGLCYAALRLPELAVQSYALALKRNPCATAALQGRAAALMDIGDNLSLQTARKDLLTALRVEPWNPIILVNLGYVLQSLGHLKLASSLFTSSLVINPECVHAYEGRAVVSVLMGRLEPALIDMENALQLQPSSPELWSNRAVMHRISKKDEYAVQDLEKSLAINAGFGNALFNFGNLKLQQHKFQEAVQYFSRSLESNPEDDAAMMNRGVSFAFLKNFESALADFNAALEINPFLVQALVNRGLVHQTTRQYDDAVRDFTLALEMTPNDAQIYVNRANLFSASGNVREAMLDFATALEINPNAKL